MLHPDKILSSCYLSNVFPHTYALCPVLPQKSVCFRMTLDSLCAEQILAEALCIRMTGGRNNPIVEKPSKPLPEQAYADTLNCTRIRLEAVL